MSFSDLLNNQLKSSNSLLCIGLDPVLEKLPTSIKNKYKTSAEQIFQFNKSIIDETYDLVCAYKPNSAFYEAEGIEGISALKQTCEYIKKTYSNIPIILDAKRGDIGNTNKGYAQFAFDFLLVDAITVIPYMGIESLEVYFTYEDKGIIIGCHSSNPGAKEFQELKINDKPLYHIVAEKIVEKHEGNSNCMIFMGATYPEELIEIRKIVRDMTLLVPGVGVQGGDVKTFVKTGINSQKSGLIISSSRGIIYAGDGEDFAEKARESAKNMRNEINQCR